MNRRGFLRNATMTGAAAGLGPLAGAALKVPPGLAGLPPAGPEPPAAVHWSSEGAPVHSFQYGVFEDERASNTYFPSGRDFFMPGGFTPVVGEIFKNAALAETMKRLAAEGPDYFTSGDWAKHFVAEG